LWEVLTREKPFEMAFRRSLSELYKMVIGGGRPCIPEMINEGVREVIERGWDANPMRRPSFAEIFELFREIDFKITPGVDSARVSEFVSSVLAWERANLL